MFCRIKVSAIKTISCHPVMSVYGGHKKTKATSAQILDRGYHVIVYVIKEDCYDKQKQTCTV